MEEIEVKVDGIRCRNPFKSRAPIQTEGISLLCLSFLVIAVAIPLKAGHRFRQEDEGDKRSPYPGVAIPLKAGHRFRQPESEPPTDIPW